MRLCRENGHFLTVRFADLWKTVDGRLRKLLVAKRWWWKTGRSLERFRNTPQCQQPPKQPADKNEETHLSGGTYNLLILIIFMAPEVGLEPTTLRLTAECSAIELLRSVRGGA